MSGAPLPAVAAAFRRALADVDLAGVRAAWAHVDPGLPSARTDDELRVVIHLARTEASFLPDRARVYSHRWLTERGLRSLLPDHMRASADRLYPVVVDAVGISVRCPIPAVRDGIGGAMRDAVLDCYANGDTEPAFVKGRMLEARAVERRGLGLPAVA